MAQPELAGKLADVPALIAGDECDPDAFGARAPGSADSVNVGVAVGGRVEVDHVRDAADVDAPGRDVGGDEDIDRAGLEARERLLALALGLVAVHR
jgi:hypothetical protein